MGKDFLFVSSPGGKNQKEGGVGVEMHVRKRKKELLYTE